MEAWKSRFKFANGALIEGQQQAGDPLVLG
jgi:hypothetical protein